MVEARRVPRSKAPTSARRRHERSRRLTRLVAAETIVATLRNDPVATHVQLAPLVPELVSLTLARTPSIVARAVLALEPWLVGSLDPALTRPIWDRARRVATRCTPELRARLVIASSRADIGRGAHEDARASLTSLARPSGYPSLAATRAILLGHIALWARDRALATRCFEDAERILARARSRRQSEREACLDAEESLLVQRTFEAFLEGDHARTALLAREGASRGASRPSPRLLSLARRFVAEATLATDARGAAELFERSRDELHAMGDHAGALYTTSRLVLALRAAGELTRADDEEERARRRAAEANEAALELAFLDASGSAPPRVRDLAWRAQIAAVRESAIRWAESKPAPRVLALVCDRRTKAVRLGDGRLMLARRLTLFRVVECLIDAHTRDASVTEDALFAYAWPGTRIGEASRKKRVQTAIWSLRRELFGDAIERVPEGYRLSRSVVVER